MAIVLSAGSETWPPVGSHHLFLIGWSKYRLGLPRAPLHYGLMWPVGITMPPFFRPQWQSLCKALTAGSYLQLGFCKGTVKESRNTRKPEQNSYHLVDDIFKLIPFLVNHYNENLHYCVCKIWKLTSLGQSTQLYGGVFCHHWFRYWRFGLNTLSKAILAQSMRRESTKILWTKFLHIEDNLKMYSNVSVKKMLSYGILILVQWEAEPTYWGQDKRASIL